MKSISPPPDAAAHSAFAVARDICRRHAQGLYFAATFLPQAKRRACYAVFAFMRLLREAMDQSASAADVSPVSTVAGSCCATNSVEQTLSLIRNRLDDIYNDRLDLPQWEFRDETQHVLHAFGLTVRRYEIPESFFLDVVEGYRMDATIRRYATWTSLEKYCGHAEGAIARIVSCILGLAHSDAHRQAVQLAAAMRLTSILRDLKKDWNCGRIYLPLEDLARFGYRERDLAAGIINAQFGNLMRFEIARARDLYRQGAAGICWLGDDGSRLAASAIVATHSGILAVIERREYDVFSAPVHLSATRKLRRLALAWRLARRTAEQRVPEIF